MRWVGAHIGLRPGRFTSTAMADARHCHRGELRPPRSALTSVLVVDGDTAARTAIRDVLELEGFEVVLADGDGLKAIESSDFDAVIIDLFVPKAEGLEPIRALHERAPMVPIIALASGRFRDCLGSGQDFLDMATRLGAARGLYKPLMPRDLISAVATCVGRRGAPGPH
jgi:CheY-like chemotaxis protein